MAALYTIEQLRTVAKDKDCSITLKAIANMRERAASAFAIAWARKEPFYDAEIERLEARRASAKDDKSREAAHIARADFERKVATQKRVEQTRAQLTECRVWSENLAARELRWFRESINARGCICDRFRIVLDPKPRNSILAIRRKPKPPFVLAPDEIDDFGDPLNRSMNWYPPFAPPEQMESAFYPEELESWPFPVLDRTLTPPKKEEKSMTWHCSACGGHVADFVYASQARQQLIEQRDNAKQEVLVSRAREALAEAQSASNQSSSSSSSASERKDMEVDSEVSFLCARCFLVCLLIAIHSRLVRCINRILWSWTNCLASSSIWCPLLRPATATAVTAASLRISHLGCGTHPVTSKSPGCVRMQRKSAGNRIS